MIFVTTFYVLSSQGRSYLPLLLVDQSQISSYPGPGIARCPSGTSRQHSSSCR